MSEREDELARLRDQLDRLESLRELLGDPVTDDKRAQLESRIRAWVDTGGGDLIGRDQVIRGDLVGGDQINVGDVIMVADADQLWRAIRRRAPDQDLRQATERYLKHLVDRYRYLDFRGMGVSDRVPLRLPLVEMYVPLKARIELPEGETWARELHLAGRTVPDEGRASIGERLSEPRPVLDLLRENDGLVVLGDPGSGKTTFLKYLALKLAIGQGESLGLMARLPVLVPLSAYANALTERDVRLDDFVVRYLHDLGADLPLDTMLGEALREGGALVLLDGLDEVKDPTLRQTVVQRVEGFYTFHRRAGNRFVLTSRVVGYRQVRPVSEGLVECTLVDLADDEIRDFVGKWTTALERAARGDTQEAILQAEQEREELLAAVQRNPGVRGLAANPLLLTILALMKRQGVTLPERRVELYDQYVRTLLSSWNRARGLGRPPARDLDVVETMRILAPLALWMHHANSGAGLVKQGDLQRTLEGIYVKQGESDPERAGRQFLEDVREYAGLLLERGAGQYGFVHLTFEEYLAAVGVARLGQREIGPVVQILADHVGDPAWREVALLTVGYLGIVQQWEQVASEVVGALIAEQPGEPGQAVALMGEAVADAWPGGVTLGCKEQVIQSLVTAMADDQHVKPLLRAAAGDTLARLGDPREEATTLVGMAFCLVPAGPFQMGEGSEEHRNDTLRYDYWMARYPVTVAQFRAFADAGGYKEGRYWREAEAAGIWQAGGVKGFAVDQLRNMPTDFPEPFNLPNHRVVGVTWYEVLAFGRWLTEVWRDARWIGPSQVVRMPSEAEWEKAARGGGQMPELPLFGRAGDRLPADGLVRLVRNPEPTRLYPWGNDADPNRANYDATAIGATSAVGCFPGGASPYGCEDMAGNVWEWCHSLYRPYPYRPDDGREDPRAEDARVFRGGSFNNSENSMRCSYRDRVAPGLRGWDLGFRVVVSPGLCGF